MCASVHLRPAVLALETRFWTFYNHFSIWGSILVWFLFVIIYTAMQVPLLSPIESCSVCLSSHNVLRT